MTPAESLKRVQALIAEDRKRPSAYLLALKIRALAFGDLGADVRQWRL